jgi:hypothetical protein
MKTRHLKSGGEGSGKNATSPPTEEGILTDSMLCSFVHYRPRVFARVLRLPFLVGTLLNWRASSKTLLWHLLSLLDDESDFLEIPHADLALSLWPDLSVHSGKNKLTKWLGRFDEDQYYSRFQAIERKRGHYRESNGEKEFFPSKYKLSSFYAFAEVVGGEIMKNNLMEIESLKMRHAAHRKVVATALIEYGATAILPEMRASEKDKAKREDAPKCIKQMQLDSWEYQTLSLDDQVELAITKMYEVSEVCYRLISEMETMQQAEYIVKKVLGYQAMNAHAALEHRRMMQAEVNKPKGVKRLSVAKPDPSQFKDGKLFQQTLAKVKFGS